jgi:virginiamycin B lyase
MDPESEGSRRSGGTFMSRRSKKVLAAGLAIGLVLSLASATSAAPAGKLRQFRVPTDGASPEYIIHASDGNFWFTESFINNQNALLDHNIGRITPAGEVTEFPVCEFCFPSDIAQGADGDIYFTKNDATLGRITLDGEVRPDVGGIFSANSGAVDAHGNDLWVTDFNNDVLRRIDVFDQTPPFEEFSVAPITPGDVAVDAAGIVWFTGSDNLTGDGVIGRLNPATGAITTTVVAGFPRDLDIATDGAVWFTERFTPQAVGRLVPATNTVTLFPQDGGPQGITAAANGSVWFSRTTAGNIVQLSSTGAVLAETKLVRRSEPWGITVFNGDPWFAMTGADKIAQFDLP